MDGYPEDKKDAVALFNKYKRLRNLHDLTTTNPMFVNQNLFKKLIKTLLVAPIVKLYGYKKFCKKIDLLGQTYSFDECEKIADFTWGDNPDSFILKSELEPAIEVDFENTKFKAPVGWKSYLERLYGDWTQLPPEDKRIPHEFLAYKNN